MSTDFVVTGFKITGSVENQSGSHAVEGVEMQLIAEGGVEMQMIAEEGVEMQMIAEGGSEASPRPSPTAPSCPDGCVVAVDADGKFAFSNVQSGVYTLVGAVAWCQRKVPRLTATAPEWSVKPSHIRVSVKEDSVDLGAPFAITGFTLHGRVVDEAGGSSPSP